MRRSVALWLALGMTTVVAGAAVISSCSKSEKIVDPTYTTPEGEVSSQIRVVTWRETPNQVAVYKKGGTSVDDPRDELEPQNTYDLSREPRGTINGIILDGTGASAFQVFRREANGGLTQMFDYPLRATEKFLDGHWAVYKFSDPQPNASGSYIARGVDAAGGYTNSSPISTPAAPEDTLQQVNIRFLNDTQPANSFLPGQPNAPFGNDSTVTFDPVPGAAHYLVQIYMLRPIGGAETVRTGEPSPMCLESAITKLLAVTDHPVTFGMHQGFPGPTLTSSPTYRQPGYYVRVSALGANNELIGTSYTQCESFATSTDASLTPDDQHYVKFSTGSVPLPHLPYTGVVEQRSCSQVNEAFLPVYRGGYAVAGSTDFTWARQWRPKPF